MELNTAITYLQLFGIGFSFGIAGPCLFFCAPVLATYVAAGQKDMREALSRISIFLSGRILAYAVLGYFAGLSGELIRRLISSHYIRYVKPIAGIISIILGMIILLHKNDGNCACTDRPAKRRSSAGFFIFGFLIGCAPCGPLAALLLEIALISKSAFQGAAYALAFGLGTFLSGLIVVGLLTGVMGLVPSKILKFEKGRLIFRIACAALLILFGSVLICPLFQ